MKTKIAGRNIVLAALGLAAAVVAAAVAVVD